MYTATPIANVALFASIPACVVMFSVMTRERAVAYALMGAALFLPERVEFAVPYLDLNKTTIPPLIMVLLVLASPKKLPQSRTGASFFSSISVAVLLSVAGTVLNNRQPLALAPGFVAPGLNITNIVPKFFWLLFYYLIPFYLGERVLGSREGAKTLLKVISNLGMVYVLLMLVELRVSPQLHAWVYGYHQHSFAQAVRAGGYRPLVFTLHGLVATMFMVAAIFATISLMRANEPLPRINAKKRAIIMLLLLAFCNSMGSLIYGVLVSPLLWFAKPQKIRKLASWGTIVIIGYPLLRSLELLPTDEIIAYLQKEAPDRAASLLFRFMNEDDLLTNWRMNPWFGSGADGRIGVFNDEGNLVTVFDGLWIIILASYGYVGFITQFTLFLSPIWFAAKAMKKRLRVRHEDLMLVAGLTMIVFIHTFELLINAMGNCLLALSAGTLLGLVRSLEFEAKSRVLAR